MRSNIFDFVFAEWTAEQLREIESYFHIFVAISTKLQQLDKCFNIQVLIDRLIDWLVCWVNVWRRAKQSLGYVGRGFNPFTAESAE